MGVLDILGLYSSYHGFIDTVYIRVVLFLLGWLFPVYTKMFQTTIQLGLYYSYDGLMDGYTKRESHRRSSQDLPPSLSCLFSHRKIDGIRRTSTASPLATLIWLWAMGQVMILGTWEWYCNQWTWCFNQQKCWLKRGMLNHWWSTPSSQSSSSWKTVEQQQPDFKGITNKDLKTS